MKEETLSYLQRVAASLVKVTGEIRQEGNEAIATGDHVAVIKHFNDLRQVNAIIKESRKALEEIEKAFSSVHVPDIIRLTREKTGQKPPFHIEGIGRVSVAHKFACSIVGEDKSIGHKWLRDHGYGELVTETVNSSTLAAFAKDLMENKGEELPDDIFKTSLNPYTSITKAK